MPLPARRRRARRLLLGALGWTLAALPATAQPDAQPVLEALRIASPDGRLALEMSGLIQIDARVRLEGEDDDAVSQFVLRRARIRFVVDVDDRFRFHLEPDFGEGEVALADGWAEAHLGGGVRARVGRFKVPFGYESIRSSRALRFAERGLPTALSPRRDFGVMLHAALADDRAEFALGLFNGVPDGQSERGETSGAKDLVGRVFARPFTSGGVDVGVGVAASVGAERGAEREPALPEYDTPGGRPFFQFDDDVVARGARVRLGPQGYVVVGPASLLAEYTWTRNRVRGDDASALLTSRAWGLAAAWSVTGERQRDGALRPRRPLGAGGAGAFEVAARVHGLRVDPDAFPRYADASRESQRAVAVGLAANWYPTASMRLSATVERTTPDAAIGMTFEPETLLVLRTQLSF